MNIIAAYPRTMSAWLSNLLTIPGHSLYGHDALHQPDELQKIIDSPLAYKGVVDTSVGFYKETIQDDWNVTVIDARRELVQARCEKLFGTNMRATLDLLQYVMEDVKDRASEVYHYDEWEDWIRELYEFHTGLPFDEERYNTLLGLNMQSQFAVEMKVAN